MGRKIPVSLGHLEFPSQKDAKEHFKQILGRYQTGETLEGTDFVDVEALLCNHPRAGEKIGSGIRRLYVESDEYNGRCFHIERKDHSFENFSYLKSITGDVDHRTRFSKACRKVVEDDLHDFKKRYFDENDVGDWKVRCPETKETISFSESHVDHRPPMTFSMIVHFFIETQNIDLESVEYSREGEYGSRFLDNELIQSFRDWHSKHAILRVIKGTKNLAKAFQGRVAMTQADRKLV